MSGHENLRITRETFDAWNAHDPERYVKQLDEKWLAESETIPAPVSGHAAARVHEGVHHRVPGSTLRSRSDARKR
jgi:hypothetical protein